MGRSFDDDPLTLALRPPEDETPQDRAARERREQDAKRVSDTIDEQIRTERAALKKKKKAIKVLLLGQAESGKSTTLKNFQYTHARKSWTAERASWRAVVQLNLIRNIATVLAHLSSALSALPPGSPGSPSRSPPSRQPSADEVLEIGGPPLALTERHRLLVMRLRPLRQAQADLEKRLGASARDPPDANEDPSTFTTHAYEDATMADPCVRGWKSALERLLPPPPKTRSPGPGEEAVQPAAASSATSDPVSEILAGCADDMRAVWADPVVRELLRRREVRMEDAPGFFLNDIERIASRTYEPSDDDVIRARLRTVGVQEHRFLFESGSAAGMEWLLYDVGGHRRARPSWIPFFDDADAIIFLAPVSAFDEMLGEDGRVNRLEDTYLLWKAINRSQLLVRTQIVLFLNKVDILHRKLASGIKVSDTIPSYGDRTNDANSALKYFQLHFREVQKTYSPEPRPFYVHLTSVIDTKATATTLGAVEEGILRDHLRRADLL